MKNILLTNPTSRGISVKFRNKKYNINWPKEIWERYPKKQILINNYVPLVTISLPLLLTLKKIYHNLPEPAFQEKYKKLFLKDLPGSTQDNKQDALKLIQQFKNINYIFEKQRRINIKLKEKRKVKNKKKHKAIIPLSFGKDSLLTLAVSREISLNPVTVYINDTVSPKENKQKLNLSKKIAKKFRLKHHIIQNSIEKLNDFETWDKPETNFNYAHMITGFCFIALPFVQYYNSKYILIGSEQDMDFSFKTWQNLKAWPAYDQTTEWQKELNIMIKGLTNKSTEVTSIIRPLTNIAIIKTLHKRYPKIAKYQFSCDCLDASRRKRWCHKCNKCARLFLFMKSFGIHTKAIGLRNLFQKKHKKLYSLFKGKEVDRYEKNIAAREQQLLAFLLATRQGSRGHLIDYFKKHYLKEAKEREDELRKKYFKLWPADIPKELRKRVLSIYKEELKELR